MVLFSKIVDYLDSPCKNWIGNYAVLFVDNLPKGSLSFLLKLYFELQKYKSVSDEIVIETQKKDVLESYLPAMLSREQTEVLIDETIAKL